MVRFDKILSMFKSISIRDFQKKFSTEDDCRKYLFDLKWQNGYHCRRCNHYLFYPGRTAFHARCRSCDYDESVTAGTLFHKIKFPLLKAFGIIFFVCVRKKGMSTVELSRTFAIRQKTAWLFKRKLQMAMADGGFADWLNVTERLDIEIRGHEMEEAKTEIKTGAETEKTRCYEGSILIARKQGYPISATGTLNADANVAEMPLEEARKLLFRFRKKRSSNNYRLIPDMIVKAEWEGKPIGDIILTNLKKWLKGIHHHCSLRFLQGYLDEFFFRFNCRNQLNAIWHQILIRLISRPPYFYKPDEL